jgi:ankyrin repeat protein
MGSALIKSAQPPQPNYKGILPEETLPRVTEQPNTKKNTAEVGNENRDINFTSGLIYSEALVRNEEDVLDPSIVFRFIKQNDLPALQNFIHKFYRKNSTYHQIHSLRGMWNSNPLMVSLQYHQLDIFYYLISLLPQNIENDLETRSYLNAKNDKGASIVLYAAIEGLTDVFKFLYDKFSLYFEQTLILEPTKEPIYNPKYDRSIVCSPFSVAVMNGNLDIISVCCNHNCHFENEFPFAIDTSTKKFNSKSPELQTGVNPFVLAISFGQRPVMSKILQEITTLQAQKVLRTIDSDGCNFLHYLARFQANPPDSETGEESCTIQDFFQAIIDKALALDPDCIELNMHRPDKRGFCPLAIACDSKNVHFATILLKLGSNPSEINLLDGFTPLHYAIKRRAKDLVEVLLEYGADPLLKGASTDDAKVSPTSAYEFCCKSLKPNNEIYIAIDKVASVWTTMRSQKDEQLSTGADDNNKMVVSQDVVLNSNQELAKQFDNPEPSKEEALREGDIVEKFFPPDESMVGERLEHGTILNDLYPVHLESFLNDSEDFPYPVEGEMSRQLSEDLSTDQLQQVREDKPESNTEQTTPEISPIQAYLALQVEGIKNCAKKEDKENEETFEDFIENLLIGSQEESNDIVQLAETLEKQNSPPRQKAPVQPKRPQFKGKRKSTVTVNSSTIPSSKPSEPTAPLISQENKNSSSPLVAQPPQNSPYHSIARPVRKGSTLKQATNRSSKNLGASASSFTPKPPSEPKPNSRLADIVVREQSDPVTQRNYNLMEKIQNLTMLGDDDDDLDRQQEEIDLTNLTVLTRSNVREESERNERTVRIKR